MSSESQILARTIYGEARGEYYRMDGGLPALVAIANVVMNRLHQRTWYGRTVQEVCQKPWQFSCWNVTDPNHHVLVGPICSPIFDLCLEVADRVMVGSWPDLTGGCDHYHAMTLKVLPPWTLVTTPRFRVGQHLFYDLRGKGGKR